MGRIAPYLHCHSVMTTHQLTAHGAIALAILGSGLQDLVDKYSDRGASQSPPLVRSLPH